MSTSVNLSSIRIAVIGAGNLGQSMALGWANAGEIPAAHITCTRRQLHLLDGLIDSGIQVTEDNLAAVRGADVVILALKPFKAQEILTEIAPALDASKTVVSVMSSIELRQLSEWSRGRARVFRAMPNTATGIAQSITCISHPKGKSEGLDLVTALFEQLGRTVEIEESLMEAATVLGACGIAYVMRFIRAMVQGGIQIGFDSQTASLIANQTVKGAAELLLQGGRHPEEEIDRVTTPKGCTIVGLNEMEHQGFSSALIRGIVASYTKIEK